MVLTMCLCGKKATPVKRKHYSSNPSYMSERKKIDARHNRLSFKIQVNNLNGRFVCCNLVHGLLINQYRKLLS